MDLTAITKTLTYVPPDPGQTSKAVGKTSDVTVLSTTHGQQRRVERNITRRDLQVMVVVHESHIDEAPERLVFSNVPRPRSPTMGRPDHRHVDLDH
jgi:hypothetical protein